MSEVIESKKLDNGLVVNVVYDVCPESPREWDNLGTMVCFHRRYSLGDRHSYKCPREAIESLAREYLMLVDDSITDMEDSELMDRLDKKLVVLPLYLYDHSGITINTTGFSCGWDSGQVGFIYASNADARKYFQVGRLTPRYRDRAFSALVGEVEVYDQYLRGEVYAYEVIDPRNEEVLDSCYGYYGGVECCLEDGVVAGNGLRDVADLDCD